MKDLLLVFGNLAILVLFAYVVFGLGYSGWWMLFPIFFHFTKGQGE